MKLIDRSLFAAFLKAYLLCLVSLLSLYVVIDLFTKLDDFAEAEQVKGLLPLVRHIATYYGYQVIHIFDQLCEPIVLLAAMFTVTMMQRSNELIPLLSAGVSTRRVGTPADSSGSSSLFFCTQATVNIAASRTIASHSWSKMRMTW